MPARGTHTQATQRPAALDERVERSPQHPPAHILKLHEVLQVQQRIEMPEIGRRRPVAGTDNAHQSRQIKVAYNGRHRRGQLGFQLSLCEQLHLVGLPAPPLPPLTLCKNLPTCMHAFIFAHVSTMLVKCWLDASTSIYIYRYIYIDI